MTASPPPPDPAPSALDALSWSVLLARWTDFARASLAFPKGAEGKRWRAATAPVIGLQALAFALSDLGRLPAPERALALDRADAGVRSHAGALHRLWAGEPLPSGLAEVIDDARLALALAASAGEEQRVAAPGFVAPDPTPIAQAMLDSGFRGDLWAALPGTRLARGAPAAFARPAFGALRWPGAGASLWSPHRQVYRQVDGEGSITRDLIAPVQGSLPPGRPLLAQVIDAGALVFRADAAQQRAWVEAQRRAGVGDQAPPLADSGAGGAGAGGSD